MMSPEAKKKQSFKFFVLATLIGGLRSMFFCAPSYAWSDHYIITEHSLRSTVSVKGLDLDAELAFEAFETFVDQEKVGLVKFVSDYYDWLASRHSQRFLRMEFDPALRSDHSARGAFLHALRLNPSSQFEPVLRLLPGEKYDARYAVKFEQISTGEDTNHNFTLHFRRLLPGEKPTIRRILYTASDEPDWQIDHGLWSIPEYGYGKIPFGSLKNGTDKAAFHMQFAHENFLLKRVAPEITQGMVQERLELFSRLAKFAFQHKHEYWGYRFTGWAIHYIQDISQPYHAKALPFESFGFYMNYLFARDKTAFKSQATLDLENRHVCLEDLLAAVLEDGYLNSGPHAPQDGREELSNSMVLKADDDSLQRIQDPQDLFMEVSTKAAHQAFQTDRSVMDVFGEQFRGNPNYRAVDDVNFNHLKLMRELSTATRQKFVKQATINLANASQATRALLRMLRN